MVSDFDTIFALNVASSLQIVSSCGIIVSILWVELPQWAYIRNSVKQTPVSFTVLAFINTTDVAAVG